MSLLLPRLSSSSSFSLPPHVLPTFIAVQNEDVDGSTWLMNRYIPKHGSQYRTNPVKKNLLSTYRLMLWLFPVMEYSICFKLHLRFLSQVVLHFTDFEDGRDQLV